ncbi:cingulin-like 1 [Lobaria immixta]|nr:cingulin-like 1 [Lobaria immixta]
MAFQGFLFVFSTILEITEDIYLFWESHYDRQRDFEKLDDFIDLCLSYGLKLLCSAFFAACLALWTWYYPPLKHASRRDLQAERDNAINRTKQLEYENLDLKALSDKMREKQYSTQHEYGLLATANLVLENKLAFLGSQPDLHSKCSDLESSLELYQEQYRHLEESLERSKRLRRDEDCERKALRKQVDQAKSEIIEVKAMYAELEEATKAKQAIHRDPELTSLENTRDQASQNHQVEVIKAYQDRIAELERLLEAKDTDCNNFMSRELENTGHQLSEIAHLPSDIAWTNAERANLRQQLHAKDVELGRITAQHLQERESLRANAQVLQDATDARENAMVVDLVPENNAMDIDIVPDHVCDHSRCLDQANLRGGQIENLEASLMDRDLKIDRLRSEAEEQGMKIEGLLAQLADQKAAIKILQESVETNGRNWSQAKEKALEVEKAGRQTALEAERAIARERLQSNNPLKAEVVGLKKALAEMTAKRDLCQAANESYLTQSFEAQKAVEAGEEAQREVEKQRDALVKANGQLQVKMAGMVEIERMNRMEDESGVLSKRRNDKEEDARAAEILLQFSHVAT